MAAQWCTSGTGKRWGGPVFGKNMERSAYLRSWIILCQNLESLDCISVADTMGLAAVSWTYSAPKIYGLGIMMQKRQNVTHFKIIQSRYFGTNRRWRGSQQFRSHHTEIRRSHSSSTSLTMLWYTSCMPCFVHFSGFGSAKIIEIC